MCLIFVCFLISNSFCIQPKKRVKRIKQDEGGEAGGDAGGDASGDASGEAAGEEAGGEESGEDDKGDKGEEEDDKKKKKKGDDDGDSDEENSQAGGEEDINAGYNEYVEEHLFWSYDPIYYEGTGFTDAMYSSLAGLYGFDISSIDASACYFPFLVLYDIVDCPICYAYHWPYDNQFPSSGNIQNCSSYAAPNVCQLCVHSFFLFENQCFDTCPDGTHANTSTLRCDHIRNGMSSQYVKPFSKGSCLNRCGKASDDCSCCPEDSRTGQLCFDFYAEGVNCEGATIYSNGLPVPPLPGLDACRTIANCLLCHDGGSGPVCQQCELGYLLQLNANGVHQCVDETTGCPSGDNLNHWQKLNNDVCINRGSCAVVNCESCVSGNGNQCDLCNRGFFLNTVGECVDNCDSMVADLVTRACVTLAQCSNGYSLYFDPHSEWTCHNENKMTDLLGNHCKCKDQNCQENATCCGDERHVCPEPNWRKNPNQKKNLKGNNQSTLAQENNNKKTMRLSKEQFKKLLSKVKLTEKDMTKLTKISKKKESKKQAEVKKTPAQKESELKKETPAQKPHPQKKPKSNRNVQA
jgi:hypothetical protein